MYFNYRHLRRNKGNGKFVLNLLQFLRRVTAVKCFASGKCNTRVVVSVSILLLLFVDMFFFLLSYATPFSRWSNSLVGGSDALFCILREREGDFCEWCKMVLIDLVHT